MRASPPNPAVDPGQRQRVICAYLPSQDDRARVQGRLRLEVILHGHT